jgi:hypothetical protein
MDVCDKVTTEDSGAKDAVASMIKRLAHRNANVQLYTLEARGTPRILGRGPANISCSWQMRSAKIVDQRCTESLPRDPSRTPFYD